MTDKKKNKEKSKVSNRRKYVSTFSKLIENQTKEFEKFIRSSGIQDEIENLIQTSKLSSEHLPDLMNLPSETDIEFITKQSEGISLLGEEIRHLQEQSQMQFLEEIENTRSILDSTKIFESSLAIEFDELTKLEDTLMDLPIHDIQRSLDEYNTFNIDIKEFKPVKPVNNEFILHTRTRESIEIGNIKLRTVQDTQLQVQSLQGDVKEIKETINQDAKKKGEMLEELLDYFRKGGSSTVKVKKVKYNKKTAELIINNKTINIKADTNQHYLCKILFASKANITRAWEIYDIVEAMGEDPDILDGWMDKIYNTIRHLNEKIKSHTGFDKFILYDNKTVIVNPKYLNLS